MSHHDAQLSVPESDRRSPVTLGLVWITMVTFFPCVLAGFQWRASGVSFMESAVGCVLSCLFLLAYTVPVCLLSSRTGLGYAEQNRRVFGHGAASVINLNVIWIFTAWYGLSALLLAEGLTGIYHWSIPLPALSAGLALLMAVNNFFGFKGIANFARFFAAPVLVLWVAGCAFKAIPGCNPSIFLEEGKTSLPQAITMISSFVIGTAVWGNEADYWRYGKPRVSHSLVPLAVALLIGQILFPLTGWIISRTTGITDYGQATEFMNQWSFGGVAIIGALVLVASFFAAVDSNLFGSTQTLKSLTKLDHRSSVSILAPLAAISAALLAQFGGAKSLESIAALNCIILPTATVIVVAEYFLAGKIILPRERTNWPAIIACLVGITCGIVTSGIIPALKALQVGVCPIQTWLVALAVYLPLRLLEQRRFATAVEFATPELAPAPELVSTHSRD